MLCRPGCHLRAGVEAQLVQDILNVCLRGSLGDEETGGDFAVTKALGDQ